MNSNKIKGIFYPGKEMSGEPDYGLAEVFVRSAEESVKITIKRT